MDGQRYIEGTDPRQGSFLPERVDDLIMEDNPVRFIAVYVESLDLRSLGFTRAKPAVKGRPAYDPRILLMLYIYGYLNRIRSSRKLEQECRRNIELWWLLCRLCPDHNTISDFRMENRKALVGVFRAFVRMCAELKLISGQRVCVDGTPIKAVNGLHQSTSVELSQKKLQYAKDQLALVEEYLRDMDEADKLDQGKLGKAFALDIDPRRLPDKEELKRRIAMHEDHLRQMEESGATQLLFTDPEARVMPAKQNGKKACYNIQTATDEQSHMIVGFETIDASCDMGHLLSTAEQAKANLCVDTLSVIADKGYESGKDIEACLMNGVVPDVGFKYDREERVFNLSYVPTEITEEQRASGKPEDIRTCLHAGVLPQCYEQTNIGIELQYQGEISCFIRHEDGRVTCPMGKELCFQGEKKYGIVYGSKEACRTCPNRCTDGKTFKTVKFGPQTQYVPVIMYGSARFPLQQIPDVHQPNRYNAFGKVKRQEARVMVFIKRDIEKQKLRMQISEHPFGTIKHYDNAGYFLCKGKEKVSAEIALSYLSYNIRRALNMAGGAQALIRLLQGTAMQNCRN